MNNLRQKLESDLALLDDVSVDLWRDTGLMCVFYRGKDIAHFHDDNEIDLRLSQKFIKDENLIPLESSKYHPNRSIKSRWMEIRFHSEADVKNLLELIKRLIDSEYKDSNWGIKS